MAINVAVSCSVSRLFDQRRWWALEARRQQYRDALRPVLADRAPFTFLTPGDTAARAFPPATLTRLRAIKHNRDPHAIIRANYPVLA